MSVDWLMVALLGLVVAAAVTTALARDILTTLAAFGTYSLGLAVVWLVFRAPDVALTEAAVGAGVTTGLFLVVVSRTVGFGSTWRQSSDSGSSGDWDGSGDSGSSGDWDGSGDSGSSRYSKNSENSNKVNNSNNSNSLNISNAAGYRRLRSLLVAGAVTVGLLSTVPALPVVGATDTPGFGPLTEFFVTDSAARGIDNVVTAILVVYRGFDTFGEIAVVFTAAVAAVAVLRREVSE